MFQPRSGDSNPVEESLVRIEPEADLTFSADELDPSKPTATLTVTNISNSHVAFKVKTNNIDGYKVKPFFGIIPLNSTVHISVVQNLGSDFRTSDKLLILTTGIDTLNMSPREVIEHWKSIPKETVKEHRLRCMRPDAVQAKDGMSKCELTSRSVGSLSAIPPTATQRRTVKRKSRLSFSPAVQSLPKGTSQLENIHAALEELRTQLNDTCTEAKSMSRNVEQVWIFFLACLLALSICLVLLFMVKTCLTSPEWYC